MTEITAIKLIIKSCILEECSKRLDMTERGSPVYGQQSEQSKAVLLIVDDEIEKKINRLLSGESIYAIVKGLEAEEDYDK